MKISPSKKNTENTMSDLYFNEESDCSEEYTSDNENFHSTILQPFQFEPTKKKKCGNESHEKETTETIVRRYSSKYVLLKILQESTCAKNNLSKRDQLYRKETLLKINFTNFKKETLTQLFFYKFCEIFMNTFFTEHLQWLLLKLNIPMLQLPIYYMLE